MWTSASRRQFKVIRVGKKMHSEDQNELQSPAVDAPIGLTW